MLRPATPLSVLLFAAFALLLLSVISTPIIKAIPLGTYEGVSFGVFGWCKGDDCSPIEIGYNTSKNADYPPYMPLEEAISIPILTDHLCQRISLPLLSPPLSTFRMRLERHYLRFSSFIPSPAS